MSDFRPEILKLPMKYNVFNLNYQRIQALIIDKHTTSIKKYCQTIRSPVFETLSSEVFWSTLKEKSKNSAEFEEVYNTWLKIKPLAHLNSRQLIRLYQDNVTSLERGYQYLITQFPEEDIKEQLKSNLQKLEKLKWHILEGLRYRAQVYKIVRAPRNVDDVLASIMSKINQLKIVDPPLDVPAPFSATLDDDRRLYIFDLLKIYKIDENDLHNEILSSVPKRGHHPLRTEEEVKADLEKFNRYRNKVIQALDLKGVGEYLYAMTTSSNVEGKQYLWQSTYKKSKQALTAFSKLPFLDKLSKLRFVLYTFIFLGAYSALVSIIQPVALLFISMNVFSAISALLFYTIGIAPIWWLGFQKIKQGYLLTHDYMASWKKRDILDTLIILENTEHFIADSLSQIVIDISHFDIKTLSKRINEQKEALNVAKLSLERYAPGEKLICKGTIQKEVKKSKNKIELLKNTLNKRLYFLAAHIALRVGKDIELLEKDFYSEKMKPILSKKQIEQLAQFVRKFGDKKSIELFDDSVNSIKKWYEKIKTDQFLRKLPTLKEHYQQPWGGSKIQIDRLEGWQIILSTFLDSPIQKNAALTLNKCLKGKKELTLAQLCEAVQCLSIGEKDDLILEIIQEFIFKTLQDRSPQYASLLSLKQKEMISEWYNQNKNNIDKARIQINRLFSNGKLAISELNVLLGKVSNEELSQYFELLDAEDIYCYAMGTMESLKARHNLIRTFFEEYDGSTSHAYRLVSFVPKTEQPALAAEFALKRLSWLLANVKKGINLKSPFDDDDIALFNNRDLHQGEKFDFTQTVMNSSYFNAPWSKEMEGFLNACKKNGLDSGGLLSKYIDKKGGFNSFLFNQKEKSCRRNIKRSCVVPNVIKGEYRV